MARVTIKRGNDQVITLVGLRTTEDPPVYLNTAMVLATLQDSRGQVVQPFEEVPMVYVDGSDGDYQWTIEGSDAMLPKGSEYSLIFTADQDGLNYRTVHVVSVVD